MTGSWGVKRSLGNILWKKIQISRNYKNVKLDIVAETWHTVNSQAISSIFFCLLLFPFFIFYCAVNQIMFVEEKIWNFLEGLKLMNLSYFLFMSIFHSYFCLFADCICFFNFLMEAIHNGLVCMKNNCRISHEELKAL